MPKKPLPSFKSEAEEAQWYAENQARLDEYFEPLPRNPVPLAQRLGITNVEENLPREAPSKAINIRIPNDDLERAKAIAAKKGLPYQTYLKMIIHEALERDAI